MFKREILEKVEKDFHARRKYEEQAAAQRVRELEEKNEALRLLGLQKRSFGPLVLAESLKGREGLDARIAKIRAEHKAVSQAYEKVLEDMGYSKEYILPRITCQDCKDTGYFQGKMCHCLKKKAIEEGYRASGIGKLLEKQRFDNFDLSFYSTAPEAPGKDSPREVMEEIFEFCRDYAENFSLDSPSLLFIGGTGLGKTHLSSAIAGTIIERAFDVVYESAPAVASIFEKERFESEEDALGTRRLMEAELLILDDLGTEPSTRTSSSAIYRLINQRVLVSGLPTIISTNLTYRQLEKEYDSAVLSRLLGEFNVKFFRGEDIRMAKLRR
ncbi:MAG: ATP-binding protein [Clostridia bacterium]|nr:ATP-binding protein [Clostridia bacterium]